MLRIDFSFFMLFLQFIIGLNVCLLKQTFHELRNLDSTGNHLKAKFSFGKTINQFNLTIPQIIQIVSNDTISP